MVLDDIVILTPFLSPFSVAVWAFFYLNYGCWIEKLSTLEHYLQKHPETIIAMAYFDMDFYELQSTTWS